MFHNFTFTYTLAKDIILISYAIFSFFFLIGKIINKIQASFIRLITTLEKINCNLEKMANTTNCEENTDENRHSIHPLRAFKKL